MKKNESYFAVNNQEDEDGYTLYPINDINNENVNEKQVISAPNNKIANPQPGVSRSELRRFGILSPARQVRNNER